MSKTPKLTVIRDVTLDIETTAGVDHIPLVDLEAIEAGARFRVHARTPIAGYFYVVILDRQNSVVDVAYPTSATQKVVQGAHIIAPDARSWLVADATGPLRVVIADQPVAPGQWPKIGDGRDGDAHMPVGNKGFVGPTVPTGQPTPPPTPPVAQPPANRPKQPHPSK